MLWAAFLCYILVAPHQVALAASEENDITPPSVESVQAVLQEAAHLVIESKDGHTQNLPSLLLQDLTRNMEELTQEFHRLEGLTAQVMEKESLINRLVRIANTQQLKALVLRLNDTLKKETEIRKLERQQPRWRSRLVAGGDQRSIVTHSTLEDRLSIEAIMDQSELEMKRWILDVIQVELNVYKNEIMPRVDMDTLLDGTARHRIPGGNDVDGCPSTADVVQTVQQALNEYANDGIGRIDHAQGAQVVHWWTSETYSPPAEPFERLGSVWWRKFIPEDWERLFPEGWEDWSVAMPSYLFHSLGFLQGDLAPPETILQKNTLPGACWPMAGTNGQVTFKLAYPVVVDAISIDHVSKDIVPAGRHTAAPKHMRVVGYPPCNSNDLECLALGFDMSDPIDVAQIMYDVESGTSVQTFESNYAKATSNLARETKPGDGKGDSPENSAFEVDAPGTCSGTGATSCSAPPRISVVGVAINVLGNWGNDDFTCLYRVRIHGETDV